MSRRPVGRTLIAAGLATLLLVVAPSAPVMDGRPAVPTARAQAPAEPLAFPTPSERADYGSYTAPDEVATYLDRLSREVEGLVAGTLPDSRIPVARIASTGADLPLRVLVVAAQHGTERAGLEAGLQIARDLGAGALARLRSRIEVRIVPMANPHGVENRRRASEEGVDLDRDHVRLEALATRALWAEYVEWRPHLVLDLHELGPSEYPLQVGVPTHPNAPGARRLARYHLMPYVANALARADVPFHEYVATWLGGETTERAAVPAGDTLEAGEPAWFTPPPLDPSSARNAFALAGSVSFYIATSSSRDILGLRERTERLHLAVSALLTAAAARAPGIIAAHEVAARVPKDSLVVRGRYVEARPGAAVPWIFVNERGQREQGHLRPWRSRLSVARRLSTPRGWWIEPGQRALIEMLRAHGFEVEDPGADGREAPPSALAYRGCPEAGDRVAVDPGEVGPEAVDPEQAEPDAAELVAIEPPPEAVWVAADQPGGRLLFTLIEPWSRGGWFTSGGAPSTHDCDPDGNFPVYRAAP